MLTLLVILYRLIIVLSLKMRAYLLYIRFRLIRREVINTIVKKSYVGDWFLFYMLGQNVDSMIFKEVTPSILPHLLLLHLLLLHLLLLHLLRPTQSPTPPTLPF